MTDAFQEWNDPEADDPAEGDEQKEKTEKKLPTEDFHCAELYEHHAELYVRYLQAFRALEECYDQVIHPQKGEIIHQTMLTTLNRMLDHHVRLIHLSNDPGYLQQYQPHACLKTYD
eukprot:UN00759